MRLSTRAVSLMTKRAHARTRTRVLLPKLLQYLQISREIAAVIVTKALTPLAGRCSGGKVGCLLTCWFGERTSG